MQSITKKQLVATTGLALILFLIVHLAGNLLIYLGADFYNGYAHHLKSLGKFLWVPRIILLSIFATHVLVTALLVIENGKARGITRYAVDQPRGNRSWATRFMPYTGTYLLLFVVYHILDFTAIDSEGPRGMIGGVSKGVYGVVVNSFADPMHSILYILAMCFLGMHLVHGVQSFVQTFGFRNNRTFERVQMFSRLFALAITAGFCSIPIYVLFVLTG